MTRWKLILSVLTVAVLAGCAPQQRRYPEFVVNAPAPFIAEAIAANIQFQADVERKTPDRFVNLHTLLSKSENKVIVKSISSDKFNEDSYLKLYYLISQISPTSSKVNLRINAVQNQGTSLQREVELYDAGGYFWDVAINTYEEHFKRLLPFIEATAAKQGFGAPAAISLTRSLVIDWTGVGSNLPGTLTAQQTMRSATFAVTLPQTGGACLGNAVDDGRSVGDGSWTIACPDGLSASGSYNGLAPNRSFVGEGRDNQGRKIAVKILAN